MLIRWLAGLTLSLVLSSVAWGATFATPNFVAHAEDAAVAEKVACTAEYFRRELAQEWIGEELPRWSRPCPIQVSVGSMGASGSTTFTFEDGEVHSWDMRVRGSMERILDSVVPHEVCHTIFASRFRRPLPRWADEGAATLVEHPSERLRQVEHLNMVFRKQKQIPLKKLFEIREYPSDPEGLYTLYAEGYSLAEFLVQRTTVQATADGKRAYLQFLADALSQGWDEALLAHYGYQSTDALETDWHRWVIAGSPSQARGTQLASHITPRSSQNSDQPLIRSQSPEAPAPLAAIARPFRRVIQTDETTRIDAALKSTTDIDVREPGLLNGRSHAARPLQLRLPVRRH